MKCDHGGCQTDATHTITAAYPAGWNTADNNPHPLFRAYPFAMFRACRNHLAALMEGDSRNPGSTPVYLVGVIE
ncbi:MAG: hypothetical protein MUP76_09805 [Acidimicrobiia bacterium]|nr:hypothetical protein [Acidimicrobiia bacterium]